MGNILATIILAVSLSFGFIPNAQSKDFNGVWRGNWDGAKDRWVYMTTRTSPNGKTEVIYAHAKYRPYFTNKAEAKDGKLGFEWKPTRFDFALKPDGTLAGTSVWPKGQAEIIMERANAANAWEGIWSGSGEYWTVMYVQPISNEKLEVIMTFVNGVPFYSDDVELKDGKFSFAWGQNAAYDFIFQKDGTLAGTYILRGATSSTITLKKMSF